MRQLITISVALVFGIVLVGCSFDKSRFADLQECTEDAECASGVCESGYCVPLDDDVLMDVPGVDCGDTTCAVSEVCCADQCVNSLSDPSNCGACGVQCGTTEACADGVCTCGTQRRDGGPACDGSTICCGDRCVNPATDASNCMECGNSCGASALCVSSECTCSAGLGDCDEDGSCSYDLLRDSSHCGACGNACDNDQNCTAGRCSCDGAECGAGEACCVVGDQRACADVSNSRFQCGDCDTQCRPGEDCNNGACQCGNTGMGCGANEVCCNGSCATECLCGDANCDTNETCCGG